MTLKIFALCNTTTENLLLIFVILSEVLKMVLSDKLLACKSQNLMTIFFLPNILQ